MPLLLFLFFAHYIGDYALQSAWMAKAKYEDAYVLYSHAMIYTSCVSAVLLYFQVFSIWMAFYIGFGHYLIDYLKIKNPEEMSLLLDQMLHLAQLVIIFYTILV